jgi:hypothetical protein
MLVGSAQSQVLNLTMGYSASGNITSVGQSVNGTNSPSFTNTYAYDAFDRLSSASSVCSSCAGGKLFETEQYTFDSLSRMVTRKFGSNSPLTISYGDSTHKDAPTSYNGTNYGYDADGNQTTRTTGTNTQAHTFDPENRVTQIISNTTSGPITTNYIYDANGARVLKVVNTRLDHDIACRKGCTFVAINKRVCLCYAHN